MNIREILNEEKNEIEILIQKLNGIKKPTNQHLKKLNRLRNLIEIKLDVKNLGFEEQKKKVDSYIKRKITKESFNKICDLKTKNAEKAINSKKMTEY